MSHLVRAGGRDGRARAATRGGATRAGAVSGREGAARLREAQNAIMNDGLRAIRRCARGTFESGVGTGGGSCATGLPLSFVCSSGSAPWQRSVESIRWICAHDVVGYSCSCVGGVGCGPGREARDGSMDAVLGSPAARRLRMARSSTSSRARRGPTREIQKRSGSPRSVLIYTAVVVLSIPHESAHLPCPPPSGVALIRQRRDGCVACEKRRDPDEMTSGRDDPQRPATRLGPTDSTVRSRAHTVRYSGHRPPTRRSLTSVDPSIHLPGTCYPTSSHKPVPDSSTRSTVQS